MAGSRSAAMVGRDAQLGDLRALVAAAAYRRPSVVVVLGEAGIGKTRLVEELIAELRGARDRDRVLVARGNCLPGAAQGLPLAPVRHVLQDLEEVLGPRFGRANRDVDGAVTALLGGGPDAVESRTATAPPSQARFFDAVARLLRDVARTRRLVVVVEDIHWADATSRELMEFLARSLREEQLVFIVTARTDDPAFDGCRALVADLTSLRHGARIELPRLTAGEIAEQVAALTGRESPRVPDIPGVIAISGGVPLLVEEVVDADLDHVPEMADLLLGHRISRLSPAARMVVEAAAVAVLEPAPEQLADATPLPYGEFDAAFHEAISHGVLVRGREHVAFRHALLREATLARVLPNAERELHRRWAAVIGPHPAGHGAMVAAAHHRRHAGDNAGALDAYLAAARLAHRISANVEEAKMYEAAAELWPRVPDAAERTGTELSNLYGNAAWALHVSLTDLESARRLVDAAVATLPADASAHRRAMLRLLWQRTRWETEDRFTAEEVLAAVADVEMNPPTEEAMLACLEAVDALCTSGDLGQAEGFARRAVAIAEATGSDESTARAVAYLASVQARRGEEEAAMRTAERAVLLASRVGDLFIQSEALTALEEAQWTAGINTTATNDRRVELLGGERPGPLPGRWCFAMADRVVRLIDGGRWEEAQAALDLVLAEPLTNWMFWYIKRPGDQLAVWRGGTPTRTPDMPPPRHAQETIEPEVLLAWGYRDTDIAARLGDFDAARVELRSVLADTRVVGRPGLLPLLWVGARIEADAAVARPGPPPEDGEWIVRRIHDLLARTPPRNPRDRAYAAHAGADLERRSGTDTTETWAAVVAGWREVTMPFPLATALVRAGAAYAAAGLAVQARAALQEAVETGNRLGAGPLVEEALAVARQARLRLADGRPSQLAALGLTPRELDVLRLVATGASNQAIATALYISRKTASVHVSHILAKLGASTRGEAAALAHRAGIFDVADPH